MRRILTNELKPGMITSKNIFDSSGRLLLASGAVLCQRSIRKLDLYDIESIHISDIEDSSLFNSPHSKSDIIYEESYLAIKNIMENIKAGNSIDVKLVKDLVVELVDYIVEDPNTFMQLSSIRELDNYTFLHSIDVCIYSIILGNIIGLDIKDLHQLGMGSILHDIGKSRIPSEILLKPSALTAEEYDIVKTHTVLGYEIIYNSTHLDNLTASIALNHHERWNGEGYPRGIKGDYINLFSRIVTICDIYDALTADRIYHKRILPHEAAEYLLINRGQIIDPNLANMFIQNVALYPVGTTVLLNTGEIGKITRINSSMPLRPVVEIFSHTFKEIKDRYSVNLKENLTLFIEDVVN